MYNLKINVTDLLSSKKKNKNEMWFLCVFWLLQKHFVLGWNHWLWYSKVLSGMLMENDWILKKKVTNICVWPCMASYNIGSLLDKAIIHPAACLWGESGDVQ